MRRVWSSCGLFDRVWVWSPEDLCGDFASAAPASSRKGDGWWRWKPEVALRTMESDAIREGDVMFYLDAGCAMDVFGRPSRRDYLVRIIDSMQRGDADGLLFCQMRCKDRSWIKPGAGEFVVGVDALAASKSGQFMGGMWAMRKSRVALGLLREWKEYSANQFLLDEDLDWPGASARPIHSHYKWFRAHRHDQSVFSMIVSRSRLRFYVEPCFDTSASYNESCGLRAMRRRVPRAQELPPGPDGVSDDSSPEVAFKKGL